jgi:hypothetical protein
MGEYARDILKEMGLDLFAQKNIKKKREGKGKLKKIEEKNEITQHFVNRSVIFGEEG